MNIRNPICIICTKPIELGRKDCLCANGNWTYFEDSTGTKESTPK